MAEAHVHGPDCHHDHDHDHEAPGHVHGPGCGHDHTHAPSAGLGEYYLEQLLTIFACGAFGAVAVLMYFNTDSKGNTMLKYILAEQFWPWVLGAGIVLLVLAFVRGIVVWRQAGAVSHVHGDDCGHENGDCGHDHAPGEAHAHGNIYWRVLILAFPVLLFLMGLPNSSLSKEWVERRVDSSKSIGDQKDVAAKAGDTLFDFAELNSLAADPNKRAEYEGRSVQVKGQMKKVSEKEFTLYSLKMTCCASDMVPLQARILSNFPVTSIEDHGWVEVSGKLQFAKLPGKKDAYVPVIRVEKPDGLQKIAAE
jgi:uncharacterized repeat protein (TIGR03943 family)